MATLKDLANKMRSLQKQLPTLGGKIAEEVAITVVHSLCDNIPVDTTGAMQNITVSVGSPVREYISKVSTLPRSSAKDYVVYQAEQALLSRKNGETIYITNSAPYIERLNTPPGWSRQSAGLFIEAAAQVGRLRVKELMGTI